MRKFKILFLLPFVMILNSCKDPVDRLGIHHKIVTVNGKFYTAIHHGGHKYRFVEILIDTSTTNLNPKY